MKFRDNRRQRRKNQIFTRGVRYTRNELPHLPQFRSHTVIGHHWRNVRVPPRTDLELAGETPGIEVSGSGAAVLYEGGEDVVDASERQGWVESRRMRYGRRE